MNWHSRFNDLFSTFNRIVETELTKYRLHKNVSIVTIQRSKMFPNFGGFVGFLNSPDCEFLEKILRFCQWFFKIIQRIEYSASGIFIIRIDHDHVFHFITAMSSATASSSITAAAILKFKFYVTLILIFEQNESITFSFL